MRIKATVVFSLLIVLSTSLVFGQSKGRADYQFRLLMHKQTENFGGWWVFPDMTADSNTFRSLAVAGPLFKWDDGWIETMGGVLVHQDGLVEPLANIRVSEDLISKLNVFADVEYFFRNPRLYWWLGVSMPIKIGKLNTRIGIESENVTFKGRQDSLGIGPSFSVQLPFCRKATLVTAYEFRNDGDFLRHYLVFNF